MTRFPARPIYSFIATQEPIKKIKQKNNNKSFLFFWRRLYSTERLSDLCMNTQQQETLFPFKSIALFLQEQKYSFFGIPPQSPFLFSPVGIWDMDHEKLQHYNSSRIPGAIPAVAPCWLSVAIEQIPTCFVAPGCILRVSQGCDHRSWPGLCSPIDTPLGRVLFLTGLSTVLRSSQL